MRGIVLAAACVLLVGGCTDKTTDADSNELRTDLRVSEPMLSGDGIEVREIHWKLLSYADVESGLRVTGSVGFTLGNTKNRDALSVLSLAFYDGDGLLIAESSLDSIRTDAGTSRGVDEIFVLEVGDVRTANSIESLSVSAVSQFEGLSEACIAVAHEEWDPWDYLNWRTSTISRFSSITHALPCSAYAAYAPSSTPVAEILAHCPGWELEDYYEMIGKYDQFISGWSDVRDRDGNPVQPTEVDSTENYLSDLRDTYMTECFGD